MFDYTPEGVRANQNDLALSYLHLIDKKLAKISRNVKVLTLVTIGVVIFKHKDKIKDFMNKKGE